MRSMLVVIGFLLAGCAAVPSDRLEPAAGSTANTGAVQPAAPVDHRPSDESARPETTVSHGDAVPAATVAGTPEPPPLSMTTTVPEIDVDLSGLDEVLEGLDVLLGDLDMAMSHTEGEFTP